MMYKLKILITRRQNTYICMVSVTLLEVLKTPLTFYFSIKSEKRKYEFTNKLTNSFFFFTIITNSNDTDDTHKGGLLSSLTRSLFWVISQYCFYNVYLDTTSVSIVICVQQQQWLSLRLTIPHDLYSGPYNFP